MDHVLSGMTKQSDTVWIAELQVGHSSLRTKIHFEDDDELQGFRIIEPIFHDLVVLCGLEGQFACHFVTYRDNRSPELPWRFDNQDEEVIQRVLDHYGLDQN